MRAMEEWALRFRLIWRTVTPREGEDIAQRVLLEVMTPWAEARAYGIGGGFARQDATPYESQVEFVGGLAATRLGQVIPDAHAEALMDAIRDFAATCGMRVEGGWREFAVEEQQPIPERPAE
jgi:hypothetical protein